MNCEFCQISKSFCRCYSCKSNCKPLSLCQNCDKKIHTQEEHAQDSNIVQKLRNLNIQIDFELKHVRGLLCSECEEENAYGYCKSCEQYMCQSCSKSIHNKGARLRHVLDSTVLTSEGYSNPQEIETSIRNQSAKQKKQNESPKLSNLPRNETDQVKQDIYQQEKGYQNSNTIVKVSLITQTSLARGEQFKQEEQKHDKYDEQTQQINVSEKIAKLNIQTGRTELPIKDFSGQNQQSHQSDTSSQISVPIFQPVFIDSQDSYLTMLMLIFREQAALGNLMINYHSILNLIQTQLHLSQREAKDLLLKGEQRGYVQVTVRNFGCIKSLTLISMRLPFVTCESLQWVLGSLKKDGMDSNERAIQSRIKEAFSVKVNSQLWQSILDSLESIKEPMQLMQFDSQQQQVSKNFREVKQQQYEMKYIAMFKLQQQQKVVRYYVKPIEKVEETEGTQKVVHIFLSGERYIGQDQQFNNEHILESPTDKQVYLEFKHFMEEYFLTNKYDNTDREQRELDERDEVLQMLKKNSIGQKSGKNQRMVQKSSSGSDKQIVTQSAGSSDSQSQKNNISLGDFNDDGKAIPGGRYGCAQFVKLCGTQFLKEQSLGKLACMVQKCINEDFLRYQRTLLVLTDCIDKTKVASQAKYAAMDESSLDQLRQMQLKKAEIGAKLNAVKQSIIEVLAEHKQGVSLPQLPIFLKKKLPFKLDWNQLGFAKLKDLIMSMSDQIKLELIGPNHTLAYLIYSNRYHHQNGVHSDDMQNISRYKMLISDYQKRSVDYQSNIDTKNNLLVSDSKTLEEIMTLFYQMLKEFPMGIESSKIVPWISQNLRQHFDFKTYNCNSLYEFINKFIMPTTEITIINNKPDSFLLRSKQIYSNVQTSSNASSYQMKNQSNSSLDQSNNSISTNNSKKYIKKQPTIAQSLKQEVNQVSTNQNGVDINEQQESSQQLYAQSYLPNKQIAYPENQIRRMPSGVSTFHMPGPSSFYGQNNDDSQQQTQINISHMRTNTEGEYGESQNTTSTHHQHQQSNQDQQINGLLPSHFYSSSTEYYPQPQEWTGDKMRHLKPSNNLDILPNNNILDSNTRKKVSHPQQSYKQSTFGNFIGSPIQALPDNFNNSIFGAAPFGINHEQNYSYSSNEGGGGAGFLSFTNNNGKNVQQPNFNQFYPIFDKIDSTSNSPKHNRAMSYLYNNSISSSQDQSLYQNNQLSVSQRNSFAHNSGAFNQKHGGFNTSIKQSGLEVYNEASKESSLEGATSSGKHSKKGQEEHIDVDIQDEQEQNVGNSHDIVEDVDEEEGLIPNTSIEEGIKDENQSAVTSRFIEDLLGDEDQTDNDEASQKTTVVHTPHLSISSFYQQLPQAQGSSFNPANTPNLNNQNSTFENSNENDEVNEQLIMNNLMIQVGHKSELKQQQSTANSNINQFSSYQSQSQQFSMPDNQNNLHRNMQERTFQQSKQQTMQKFLKELPNIQPQTQFEQNFTNHDDAKYMHSKTLSEDFASNSIFSNQFVFDNSEQQQIAGPIQQFQEQQIAVQVVRPPKNNYGLGLQQPSQQQLQQTNSAHHISTPMYNMQNLQGNQQYVYGNFKDQQQNARTKVEIKQPAGPPSASYYNNNSNAMHFMGRNETAPSQQTYPMNFTPMPKTTNQVPSQGHYTQNFPLYQQQPIQQPYQQQNQFYGHYQQQPQTQHFAHQIQQRFPQDQQNTGKRSKNYPQNNGKYF